MAKLQGFAAIYTVQLSYLVQNPKELVIWDADRFFRVAKSCCAVSRDIRLQSSLCLLVVNTSCKGTNCFCCHMSMVDEPSCHCLHKDLVPFM